MGGPGRGCHVIRRETLQDAIRDVVLPRRVFERDRFLGQPEVQRAVEVIAHRRARERPGRRDPVAATVRETKRGDQQDRRSQRPPRLKPAPATSGDLERRLLERRSQATHELRTRVEIARVVKGSLYGRAQRAPSRELLAAHRTRVQVTQYLVIRFSEELLRKKRIGHFTNIAAFHGRVSHGTTRRRPTAPAEAPSSARRNARPRWSRDITVPIGIARASAISL